MAYSTSEEKAGNTEISSDRWTGEGQRSRRRAEFGGKSRAASFFKSTFHLLRKSGGKYLCPFGFGRGSDIQFLRLLQF